MGKALWWNTTQSTLHYAEWMAEYAVYPQEIFQLKGRAYELQLIRWEMQLWKKLHILGTEIPYALRGEKRKITIGNICVLLWILLEPEWFTQKVISYTITFASGFQTVAAIKVFRFWRGFWGVSLVVLLLFSFGNHLFVFMRIRRKAVQQTIRVHRRYRISNCYSPKNNSLPFSSEKSS